MKKFVLAAVILFLVLSTAVIKNTTKQIEDELFTAKENIRVLKSEFENISLEYDYLSSAEKLLEYQSLYFEDELIQKDIKNSIFEFLEYIGVIKSCHFKISNPFKIKEFLYSHSRKNLSFLSLFFIFKP